MYLKDVGDLGDCRVSAWPGAPPSHPRGYSLCGQAANEQPCISPGCSAGSRQGLAEPIWKFTINR